MRMWTPHRLGLALACGASIAASISASVPAQAYVAWGSVLVPGSAWAGSAASQGDLNVYSNGTGNEDKATPYGLGYECVELAVRWAAINYGEDRYWPIWGAYQMWNAGPSMKVPFHQLPNGGGVPPQFGDLLIFDHTPTNSTGHVAVVAGTGPGYVDIVEQNYNNPNPTGRARLAISGSTMPDRWGLPIIGWLRATITPPPVHDLSAPSQYHALAPSRVMDTRVSGGGFGPNETRDLQVYGQGGVPNSSSISAVVLNVTVTDTSTSSFLRVSPQGTPTSTANLNWSGGTTISNLVTVPVNTTNGLITLYNHSGWTSVVVDVQGYYQTPVADHSGLLAPLVPCRLMDTRDGTGGRGNPLGTDTTYNLTTLSRCGIPASGVSALVLNVAATNTSTASFLTVFPTGQARPTASNLNFSPGQTIPNRVIARLGAAGNVSLYNHYGNVDVVVDVGGYFTDASSSQTTGSFIPVSPTRILDTRDGTGGFVHPLGNDSTISVSADVPSNATAVVLNVAATDPSSSSFVTAYPSDVTRPSPASDLNFSAGQTIPNAVIIKLSGTGTFSLYNHSGQTHLIADVFGYYA